MTRSFGDGEAAKIGVIAEPGKSNLKKLFRNFGNGFRFRT